MSSGTTWVAPFFLLCFMAGETAGERGRVRILLQGGHPIDENVEQLEQGLARFRYFGSYALDSWMTCHYERAQERARKAKIGVWAK